MSRPLLYCLQFAYCFHGVRGLRNQAQKRGRGHETGNCQGETDQYGRDDLPLPEITSLGEQAGFRLMPYKKAAIPINHSGNRWGHP